MEFVSRNNQAIRTASAIFLLISIGIRQQADAGESLFGNVYVTDLLPKGGKEIEQWMTWRTKKAGGHFALIEGRTAFEYGVTDDFQTAVYANYAWSRAFHNGVDGASAPPETFAGVRFGPDSHWHSGKFVGVSLEGIYRILSPYIHPIGVALYLEPTFGKRLFEVENRLILQKNFLDDRLVIASNISVILEARRLPGDPEEVGYASRTHWDHETDFNISLAAAYRFIEIGRAALSSSMRGNIRTSASTPRAVTMSLIILGLSFISAAKDFSSPEHF